MALVAGSAYMNALRRWSNKHPLTTAMGVLVIIILYYGIPMLIWGPQDLTDGSGIIGASTFSDIGLLFGAALSAALTLGIVAVLGWWEQTGFASREDRAGRKWFWGVMALPLLLLAVVLAVIFAEGASDARSIITIAFLMLAVSVFEETLFRGVILHGLRQRVDELRAFLANAAIFAAFHFVNVATGQDFAYTVFQVISAFGLGLILAGLRLQTNGLWAPVLFHMVWNCWVTLAQLIPLEDGRVPSAEDLDGMLTNPASYIMPAVLIWIGLAMFARWRRRIDAGAIPR